MGDCLRAHEVAEWLAWSEDTEATETQAAIDEPVAATTLIDAHLLKPRRPAVGRRLLQHGNHAGAAGYGKFGIEDAAFGRRSRRAFFMPPRFKRVYVDQAHGVPFLQGSHLVHFRPADLKYVSRLAHKQLHKWTIHAGWVLLTRSGTIGRVAIALDKWDGWAASEHIIRIVPKGRCAGGLYLCVVEFPHWGQAQFNGIYGAVIDEVTPDHVQDILIPVPETPGQVATVNAINELVMDSIAVREQALEQDASAIEMAGGLVSLPKA